MSTPQDPVATLSYLLGPLPKLTVSGHPLGVELMSINAYLRPSLMYGYWEGKDGTPLLQPPPFYHGLTESTAQLICSISEEIVHIAKLFQSKTGADMSRVRCSNDFFNCHNFFSTKLSLHALLLFRARELITLSSGYVAIQWIKRISWNTLE